MKDLKHMIFFEKVLESAHNDLVRQAREKDAKIAIGYTCFHIPEAILNLHGCFSVRLRAPFMGSTDIATYYLASSSCEFSRALLERGIEGGYRFLDAIAGVDICECMNRCYENMELLGCVGEGNDKFFLSYIDVPGKDEEISVDHVTEQLQRKLLKPLHVNYGIDIADQALRRAVEDHNEICDLITEIGNFRKLDPAPITGAEFHKICLATYVCPQYLIKDKLKETLEEIRTRAADEKKFRARLVIVGGEIDDPEMIELCEESGALIVADRFCYGSIPGRQRIELNDREDALSQIVRINIRQTSCPRYITDNKILYRQEEAKQLAKDYHADGSIYEQMKFCTYWSYERTLQSHVMAEEYGIPTLSIDRPYRAGASGQLKTRVQAFVESLEIKQIKARAAKREAQHVQ